MNASIFFPIKAADEPREKNRRQKALRVVNGIRYNVKEKRIFGRDFVQDHETKKSAVGRHCFSEVYFNRK